MSVLRDHVPDTYDGGGVWEEGGGHELKAMLEIVWNGERVEVGLGTYLACQTTL